MSSTIHGNVISLLIEYNQTQWDLDIYQINMINVTGTIITTFETSDSAINIPNSILMGNVSKVEIITHTRCLQESVPRSIHLSPMSIDSEVDDAIIVPTAIIMPCNGNNMNP